MPRRAKDMQAPRVRVIDMHDIEKVAEALIHAARKDVEHEGRVESGKCKNANSCDRGAHVCPTCDLAIWECGQAFLDGIQAALTGEGSVPGWHARTCRYCMRNQTLDRDGMCHDCYALAHADELAAARAQG